MQNTSRGNVQSRMTSLYLRIYLLETFLHLPCFVVRAHRSHDAGRCIKLRTRTLHRCSYHKYINASLCESRRKASADKDLAPIVEESRKKAGLFKGQPPKLSPEEIIQFIFFPVVNEGCRVIDEGIVDKPSDLDVATVMSMGFPAYRPVNLTLPECVICIFMLCS